MNNIDFVGEDPTIENSAVLAYGCTNNQDIINHNNLGGLQGGTLNERYHLTKTQWQTLGASSSPTYTFSNGLTSDDSGNVGLGGSFLSNTNTLITMASPSIFQIYDPAGYITSILKSDQQENQSQIYLSATNATHDNTAFLSLDPVVGSVMGATGMFLSITTSGMILKDVVNNKGVVYFADYSSNYTARSLVDKGYVDSVAGGNPGNGLQHISSIIGLGGALSQDTQITSYGGFEFRIDGTGGFGNGLFFDFYPNAGYVQMSADNAAATFRGFATAIDGGAQLKSSKISDNSEQSLTIDGTTILVKDNTSQMGVVYDTDYSANFVDLSVPSVGWVNKVTGIINGSVAIVAGPGAGTSPTVAVTTNTRGLQVTITPGTSPSVNAIIATITLPSPLNYPLYPVLSGANVKSSNLTASFSVYANSTDNQNVVIMSSSDELSAGTYIWNISI